MFCQQIANIQQNETPLKVTVLEIPSNFFWERIPDTFDHTFEPPGRGPKWSDKIPPMAAPARISTKPCPMDLFGSVCGARPVAELNYGKWGRHFGGFSWPDPKTFFSSMVRLPCDFGGGGMPTQARLKTLVFVMYLKESERQIGSKLHLTRESWALPLREISIIQPVIRRIRY